jgi:hypothetical protein
VAVDGESGETVELMIVDAATRQSLTLDRIEPVTGPGAGQEIRTRLKLVARQNKESTR